MSKSKAFLKKGSKISHSFPMNKGPKKVQKQSKINHPKNYLINLPKDHPKDCPLDCPWDCSKDLTQKKSIKSSKNLQKNCWKSQNTT